ncbi:MAG: hypothetical protein HQL06_17490 [Nitrospirae bacterium]|nr:hypothetical protein [Nitrospirota bacterium]
MLSLPPPLTTTPRLRYSKGIQSIGLAVSLKNGVLVYRGIQLPDRPRYREAAAVLWTGITVGIFNSGYIQTIGGAL